MFTLGIVASSQENLTEDTGYSGPRVVLGNITSQTNITSMSLLEPAHSTGDLLVLIMASETNNGFPGTPTGYTSTIYSYGTGDALSKGTMRVCTKIGTGTPTTITQAFVNGAGIMAFSGASGVLTSTVNASPGSNLHYLSVTPVNSGGYCLYAYQATDRNGHPNGDPPPNTTTLYQVSRHFVSHHGVYGMEAPDGGVAVHDYTQAYNVSSTRAWNTMEIIVELA